MTTADGELLLRITHKELRDHLYQRMNHHHERATANLIQARRMEAEAKRAEKVLGKRRLPGAIPGTTVVYQGEALERNAEALRRNSDDHDRKAARMKFLRNHLPEREVFYVSEDACRSLELLP